MISAGELLTKTALAIVVANHLSEGALKALEETRVAATHMDPDEPNIDIELKFKDQDNIIGLNVGIGEFDDIPFVKLFNNISENEKKFNATEWIETGMHDVEGIEIISCKKCHFPTIHKFDYCPQCGRKIMNDEGE